MRDALIMKRLSETARLLEATGAQVSQISAAAEVIVKCYQQGGTLLLCGNGGSAADAQHIAGEMVGRFLKERAAWPALALSTNTSILTAIANDYGAEFVFSRQVEAFGRRGDVLWSISTSGKSRNCIEAMRAATSKGMTNIVLVGGDGGEMKALADIAIVIPASLTPRVQEAHITVGHIICELVESALSG